MIFLAQKHSTISIPYPLYKKIRQFIRGTGFTSASDFVTFVLREVMSEAKEKKTATQDRETIIKKLKLLGYID